MTCADMEISSCFILFFLTKQNAEKDTWKSHGVITQILLQNGLSALHMQQRSRTDGSVVWFSWQVVNQFVKYDTANLITLMFNLMKHTSEYGCNGTKFQGSVH